MQSWPLSNKVACRDILLFTCHAFGQSLAPMTMHHMAHINSKSHMYGRIQSAQDYVQGTGMAG